MKNTVQDIVIKKMVDNNKILYLYGRGNDVIEISRKLKIPHKKIREILKEKTGKGDD